MRVTKPRVYIETTIPSYLTAWPSEEHIRAAKQELTRTWWDTRRGDFDICTHLELSAHRQCRHSDTLGKNLLRARLDPSGDMHARGIDGAEIMSDPILDEIRRYRDEQAAKFNYDLAAIFRDVKGREEESRRNGRVFISAPDMPGKLIEPTPSTDELPPRQSAA